MFFYFGGFATCSVSALHVSDLHGCFCYIWPMQYQLVFIQQISKHLPLANEMGLLRHMYRPRKTYRTIIWYCVDRFWVIIHLFLAFISTCIIHCFNMLITTWCSFQHVTWPLWSLCMALSPRITGHWSLTVRLAEPSTCETPLMWIFPCRRRQKWWRF